MRNRQPGGRPAGRLSLIAAAVGAALFIVVLSQAARVVAASAWNSVVAYRTPYNFHTKLEAGPRLVDRVILVVADGLRVDNSQRLSFLNELRKRGASGTLQTFWPSLSSPGRAAMVTGAGPEVHGITTNFATQQVEADSVFSRARQAGLRTAVSGSAFWYRGFAPWVDELQRSSDEPDSHTFSAARAWQEERCPQASEFTRLDFDFGVFDFVAGDMASHDLGGASPETFEIYKQIDTCLEVMVRNLDLQRTVVVVAADHGHIDTGGHGGAEPVVLAAPAVMAGGPVRPGATFEGRQADLAPTIAALLGLPLPSSNHGSILFSALALDRETDARVRQLQDEQKRQFAAYEEKLLGGSPAAVKSRARWKRLPVVLLVAAGLAMLALAIWHWLVRTRDERWGAVAGAVVFYVVYFVLFAFTGLGYSFSAVNKEEYLGSFFQTDMAIGVAALLAGALAAGVAGRSRCLASSAVVATAASLVVAFTLALQVLAVHWWEGLWMTQWMGHIGRLFKAYLDLLVLVALPFALPFTPLAAWLGGRLRGRRTTAGEPQPALHQEGAVV